MKKTLTVNLGGTVFNIDDDAYRLLDNYLSNLKMHFRKEAGADEIVDDIERRISELFAEKLSAGSQVITIADVEEVIARMGKPEDMEAEGESASADSGSTSAGGGYGAGAWNSNTAYGTTRRRLYRNPDDKMLGGVISGMAAYLGWDVTLLRLLLLVILICGVGTLIPVYIVCWLVIPEARTAAEKLSMRGEAVTVENIGKTVTDGFEKVANGVGQTPYFLAEVGRCIGDDCRLVLENLSGDICHYLQSGTVCIWSGICGVVVCCDSGGCWWRCGSHFLFPDG